MRDILLTTIIVSNVDKFELVAPTAAPSNLLQTKRILPHRLAHKHAGDKVTNK